MCVGQSIDGHARVAMEKGDLSQVRVMRPEMVPASVLRCGWVGTTGRDDDEGNQAKEGQARTVHCKWDRSKAAPLLWRCSTP